MPRAADAIQPVSSAPAPPSGRPVFLVSTTTVDLSGLTLTQLRYVVAVDRHRSFRTAAERCHVSQPALSMQIQKLEEILGVGIFDRSRHPVVTTESGAPIVAQARVILHEFERLGDLAHAGEEATGRYRLGVIPTLAPSLVPLLVPRLLASHPRVTLIVEERPTSDLVQGLLDDSLDGGLAATPLDVPLIHERRLFVEPFHVYLSPDHRLRERSELKQSDLYDERPWLLAEGHCFRAQVLHLCKADRSALEDGAASRVESGSFETLMRLVDAGVGLTLLPDLVVQALPADVRRRQVRPFAPPVPARQVSLVFGRDRLRSVIADAIFSLLTSSLLAGREGMVDSENDRMVLPVK